MQPHRAASPSRLIALIFHRDDHIAIAAYASVRRRRSAASLAALPVQLPSRAIVTSCSLIVLRICRSKPLIVTASAVKALLPISPRRLLGCLIALLFRHGKPIIIAACAVEGALHLAVSASTAASTLVLSSRRSSTVASRPSSPPPPPRLCCFSRHSASAAASLSHTLARPCSLTALLIYRCPPINIAVGAVRVSFSPFSPLYTFGLLLLLVNRDVVQPRRAAFFPPWRALRHHRLRRRCSFSSSGCFAYSAASPLFHASHRAASSLCSSAVWRDGRHQ